MNRQRSPRRVTALGLLPSFGTLLRTGNFPYFQFLLGMMIKRTVLSILAFLHDSDSRNLRIDTLLKLLNHPCKEPHKEHHYRCSLRYND
uniref:Uncharacterized protein n=1 Tax=Physcomitrium patens TaxID=3218 RepID=A0A2K1JR46_PHYPA|nr:hypothetical protein PHYPA_016390 [Physcomitrium patens]